MVRNRFCWGGLVLWAEVCKHFQMLLVFVKVGEDYVFSACFAEEDAVTFVSLDSLALAHHSGAGCKLGFL